eukprot:CAMPEP_0201581844 /NCGR_PEP_ID=MMETSP0190_2-20130828/75804_1 /ASSEMBLY_ACC=CAM_ASM_000263 /TAXON_ID=37353 /ORGANISM="Rosalina sp." /LENGTH=81 /DNA_ID=CAMNT_0048020583 /DNA_START=13 /DNA_END=258 /DNA_ORIENTATION=+
MGNDLHRSCCDVCSPFHKTDKRDHNLNQALKKSQQQQFMNFTSMPSQSDDNDNKSDENKDDNNVSQEQWNKEEIDGLRNES